MHSNLDVWAIQYYPEELYTALEQINDGMNIIYSNLTTSFKIGNQEINTRQFDTILYNQESDILIMLMRDGKATKEDMINYLEKNNKQYTEVTFMPNIGEYEDGNEIKELWFAREKYVLEDAIKDSIEKGIYNCEYYPNLNSSIDFGYLTNNTASNEYIDGRLSKGFVKFDDKYILIINQENNRKKNVTQMEVLLTLRKYKITPSIITNEEPNIFEKKKL